MFNVVIIDDENFIIKSLLSSIDWTSLNLEVVATFSNSVDALAFIESHVVHIVITDIRMPGITGLDLCSHIHNTYPHIRTIIMSGHADFIYAQKAIKCNVLGYCVKPLDFDELTILLRKAIHHFAKPQINYYDLIDAIENEDEPLIKSYLGGHKIDPDNFYIMVSIGPNPLTTYLESCCLTLKFGLQKYLYFLKSPYLKNLSSPTLSALSIKGVGSYPDPVRTHTLKQALHDTILMSHQFFFLGSPSVCYTLHTSHNLNLLAQLQVHLASHNLGSIQSVISELINPEALKTYNISFALKVCNLFITHYMTHYQLDIDDLYVYSIEELTKRFTNFSTMLQELYGMLSENVSLDDFPNSYNNNFIQVLQFINHNYMKDISTSDISKHLNLNQNYISQLFKKETGSTYTKYLTQLRIEKAKQLLQQTDLSLSDICAEIGYNDYFYFLKTFKKYEGMSPSTYRAQLTSASV